MRTQHRTLLQLGKLHKTVCSGETRLVLCVYLAHHELEGMFVITMHNGFFDQQLLVKDPKCLLEI